MHSSSSSSPTRYRRHSSLLERYSQTSYKSDSDDEARLSTTSSTFSSRPSSSSITRLSFYEPSESLLSSSTSYNTSSTGDSSSLSSVLQKHPKNRPLRVEDLHSGLLWRVRTFLTIEESRRIIHWSEVHGFSPPTPRNPLRTTITLNDVEGSQLIYERLKPTIVTLTDALNPGFMVKGLSTILEVDRLGAPNSIIMVENKSTALSLGLSALALKRLHIEETAGLECKHNRVSFIIYVNGEAPANSGLQPLTGGTSKFYHPSSSFSSYNESKNESKSESKSDNEEKFVRVESIYGTVLFFVSEVENGRNGNEERMYLSESLREEDYDVSSGVRYLLRGEVLYE